jgi:hypothetical protein
MKIEHQIYLAILSALCAMRGPVKPGSADDAHLAAMRFTEAILGKWPVHK